ncbi:MAG: DUF5717 family protein [Defluviitaleaceae bacterium]|nr:DUF5717 family protein [Defluviitaleaceae bacterium]
MPNPTTNKITSYEKIYNDKKTSATAFAMATRFYIGYIVSGQRDFLHKANFVATAHANLADMPMVFLRGHISYEMDNFDGVDSLLSSLKPYRNAIKAQSAELYAHYLYFNCVLAQARGKQRAANKHYRALRDYCKDNNPRCGHLLLAAANCAFEKYADALGHLQAAYKNGNRSPFLYICLGRALENATPQDVQVSQSLLLPMMRWSFSSGYYIGGIIARNQENVEEILRRHPSDGEKLYAAYPLDWILHIICTRRMINNDLSPAAFHFYKEAETRQLHFPQLYDFLIRAAHKNGIEDISRYSVVQYLKQGDVPEDILPFAYHLALKAAHDEDNWEFLEKIRKDILQCAYHAIENKLFGRYYYSLHKFLLETTIRGKTVDKKALETAEDSLKNLLFAYDITFDDDDVKKVLIQEDYKRGEVLYDVKGGRIRVNLCDGNAKITCFDESFTNIINCAPKMSKLVENVDITILNHFFAKGISSTEVLVALCQHYMDAYDLSENAIKIFESVAENGQISAAFKMQIYVSLGNFYAKGRNYPKAAEYYRHVDESRVLPRYLEQMLLTYVHAGEYGLAKRLIAKGVGHISDKNLFYAVKHISSKDIGTDAKGLAALAAQQILRGWYDKTLLDLIIKSHVTSLAGWIELARSLSAMGLSKPALHAKILDVAIQTRNSDKGVQSIFGKATDDAPDIDILKDFAVYLSYEIIVNDLIPEYDAIYAMEKVFTATGEEFLAYGLAHIYIKNSVTTANSADILHRALKMAIAADIIWPIFKEIKDKNYILPYIEKNRPFLHRGKVGHAVSFHYRTAGETDFAEMPMKYLRFGLYTCHVPHFYGEELEYYFKETIATGSVTTQPTKIENNRPHLLEKPTDLYYIINSALVYEQMFKYDKVEEIVADKLTEKDTPRAKLM